MLAIKRLCKNFCYILLAMHIAGFVSAERPIRILSIDGGGVRGLIPATVLAAIEEQTGKRITDLFDVMVGTSTGGLIVLFLNIPGTGGQGKYTAADVVKIYRDLSEKVFPKSLWRSIRTIGGLISAKWSVKPAEELLKSYFGDLTMRDAVKDIVITSFDTKTKTFFPFSTFIAKKSNLYNRKMWEAGRATTAAPTYFKPFELDLQGWAQLVLVDGAIGANNPGILGVMEAKKIYPNREYELVSLGTGKTSELGQVVAKGNLAGGILRMLLPAIGGLFSGQDQLSDQVAQSLVTSDNFFRINPEIDVDLENMDNTDPKNLAKLEAIGDIIVKNSAVFRRLIERLKANR